MVIIAFMLYLVESFRSLKVKEMKREAKGSLSLN